jgi:hypothetical protein
VVWMSADGQPGMGSSSVSPREAGRVSLCEEPCPRLGRFALGSSAKAGTVTKSSESTCCSDPMGAKVASRMESGARVCGARS